ncbi:ribosomal protein L22/L17 [Dichotomopilus funicola]|uniref:Ribosomal protein L22/L17 n=1 Tax=Dichotomopilus funicola TaxID=1934379 RepID=A0AAN6V0N3_9PEZI|nr:ribosomal protein L22/L17 [Dichotomopilus funicola]
MSFSAPSRRLLQGAPALAAPGTTTTTTTTANALLPALQALSLSPSRTGAGSSTRAIHTTPPKQWFWNRNKKPTSSPLENEVSGSKAAREKFVERLAGRLEGPAMFEDEVKESLPSDTSPDTAPDGSERRARKGPTTKPGASLVREHLARSVNPDPRARARWERKMVIRQVQRGTNPFSHEPKAARIARTERQVTSRSPFLATSTKKLVHLAHQIQGKTVTEALVQMRFSKKKFAQEVRYELERARDRAITERGMARGGSLSSLPALPRTVSSAARAGGANSKTGDKGIEIQTKDGKWVKIDDPTRMYVAEAWVNRGPWRQKVPSYRARGRMNILMRPSASISVVLKEEKTRIREAVDREAKKLRQGPWIHLPDRPVSAQRQWYSW